MSGTRANHYRDDTITPFVRPSDIPPTVVSTGRGPPDLARHRARPVQGHRRLVRCRRRDALRPRGPGSRLHRGGRQAGQASLVPAALDLPRRGDDGPPAHRLAVGGDVDRHGDEDTGQARGGVVVRDRPPPRLSASGASTSGRPSERQLAGRRWVWGAAPREALSASQGPHRLRRRRRGNP